MKLMTHRVSRLVTTPTRLTVPKYHALSGVVKIMALRVMDTEAVNQRINVGLTPFPLLSGNRETSHLRIPGAKR